MKLGISDFYYDTDWDFGAAKRYQLYRQAGFSCIDFNTAPVTIPLYTEPETEMERLLTQVRQELEAADMTVHQVHGPWCWPPTKDTTPEGRPLRAEEMKKSMRMAKLLGCDKWVVHPIMPNLLRDLPDGTAENTWQLNVEFMGWLLDYAKQIDVTICLENMPHRNFSMAKPEKVLELAKLMNDPHFAVCLDFGHVATQEGLSVADQIRLLGDKLQAVHIHDNLGEKDQHLWPMKGIIDWQEAMKALKEIGYDGPFSFETCPDNGVDEATFLRQAGEMTALARSILT